ncbi:cytochrome c oxidase subunit 1 [Thoreauomyces humboldtii]|nr:cytochrome c oxidase subunit 1 [Thoreauomyces humboldtii]
MDHRHRKRAADKAAREISSLLSPDLSISQISVSQSQKKEKSEAEESPVPKVSHLGQQRRRHQVLGRVHGTTLVNHPGIIGRGTGKDERDASRAAAPASQDSPTAPISTHPLHETFGRAITGRFMDDGPRGGARDAALDVMLVGHKVSAAIAAPERYGRRGGDQEEESDPRHQGSRSSAVDEGRETDSSHDQRAPLGEPVQLEPMIVDGYSKNDEAPDAAEIYHFNSFADVDDVVRKYTSLLEARTRQLREPPILSILSLSVQGHGEKVLPQAHEAHGVGEERIGDSENSLLAQSHHLHSEDSCDCDTEGLPMPLTVNSIQDMSSVRGDYYASNASMQKEVFLEPEMVMLVASHAPRPVPPREEQPPHPASFSPPPPLPPSSPPADRIAESENVSGTLDTAPIEAPPQAVTGMQISSYKPELPALIPEMTPLTQLDDILGQSSSDISWMEPVRQEMIVTSLKAVMQNRNYKRRRMLKSGQMVVEEVPKTFSFAKFHEIQESLEAKPRRHTALKEALEEIQGLPTLPSQMFKPLYAETVEPLLQLERAGTPVSPSDEDGVPIPLQLTGRTMPMERVPLASGSMSLGMSWTPARPTLTSPSRSYGLMRTFTATPEQRRGQSRKKELVTPAPIPETEAEPERTLSVAEIMRIPTSLPSTASMTLTFTHVKSPGAVQGQSEDFYPVPSMEAWVDPSHLYSSTIFASGETYATPASVVADAFGMGVEPPQDDEELAQPIERGSSPSGKPEDETTTINPTRESRKLLDISKDDIRLALSVPLPASPTPAGDAEAVRVSFAELDTEPVSATLASAILAEPRIAEVSETAVPIELSGVSAPASVAASETVLDGSASQTIEPPSRASVSMRLSHPPRHISSTQSLADRRSVVRKHSANVARKLSAGHVLTGSKIFHEKAREAAAGFKLSKPQKIIIPSLAAEDPIDPPATPVEPRPAEPRPKNKSRNLGDHLKASMKTSIDSLGAEEEWPNAEEEDDSDTESLILIHNSDEDDSEETEKTEGGKVRSNPAIAEVLSSFRSHLPAANAIEIPADQGVALYRRVHDLERRRTTMSSDDRHRYPVFSESAEETSLTALNSEKREIEIRVLTELIDESEVPIPAHLRKRGVFLGQQGEYSRALEDFNRAIEFDPFNSDAFWYRHQLNLLNGDVQAALRDLDAITETNRQHLGAFQTKGRLYQELGAVKMAIVNYSQVIKLKPHDSDGYLQRASLFEEENEMVYANEDYKMVRSLDPTNIPALRNLAVYSFERRLWTDSSDAFSRLIILKPGDFPAYVYRARAYGQLGRWEESLQDLTTAVKIEPTEPTIYFHRASLLRQRNPFKAIEDYSLVLLLDDSTLSTDAYYQRALLYYTLQQYDFAAADLQAVIELEPDRAQAHLTLGVLYMRFFHDLPAALRCFNKSLNINPTQTFGYLCRGDLYQLIHKNLKTDETALAAAHIRKRVKTAGKYRDEEQVDLEGPAILEHYVDLGVKEYSRAIHLAPYNHTLYLYRGKLLLGQGRMKEATYDFQTAFELSPDIAQTFIQRALVLSFQRKYTQIIEEFNKKSRLETIEDSQLFILVAKAKISCGDHSGALKNLGEALKHNKREPEVYLLRGICYEKLKDWTNAIKEFTPCVHLNPSFAKAYYHRGLCKLHMQDDQGILDLARAIKLDTEYFDAYITRAAYYQMKGEYSLAIDDCTDALRVEPTSIRAYILRGACNCKLLAYETALQDFTKAISIDRLSHFAFYNRAVTYQLMNDYENAVKDYSISMLICNDSNAYRNRGLIYWKQGDTENALLDLIAAREAFPEDSKLAALLGVCLQKLGRLDEAIEQFEAAIRLNPFMKEAFIARGNVHALKGDRTGARKDYARVIHMDPRCTEALVNMAYTLQGEGRRKKAYDLFTTALSIDPHCMAALEGRAVIQYSRNNFFGALIDICRALSLNPKNPEYLTNRGVVYQSLGDNVSAMQSYKLALKLDPTYAHAHLNVANMYFSQRKWEEALGRYTETLQLVPDTVSAYLNRGITKAMLHDLPGALEDFNHAIQIDPSIPEIFYNRAHVLQLLGRLQEAETDYTTILDLSPVDSVVYTKRGNVRGHRADMSGAMEDYAMAIAQDESWASSAAVAAN